MALFSGNKIKCSIRKIRVEKFPLCEYTILLSTDNIIMKNNSFFFFVTGDAQESDDDDVIGVNKSRVTKIEDFEDSNDTSILI